MPQWIPSLNEQGGLFFSYRVAWEAQGQACKGCKQPLDWNDAVLDCTADTRGRFVSCVECATANRKKQ
jgi:hypothetical protein